MRNITETEWKAKVVELVEDTLKRWPWMKVNTDREHGIQLETKVCSARVDLDIKRSGGELWMETNARFDSGSALMGNLSDVERGLFDYRTVVKALHFLVNETCHLRVYPDGRCPCGHCGASGSIKGSPCKNCNGEGKR